MQKSSLAGGVSRWRRGWDRGSGEGKPAEAAVLPTDVTFPAYLAGLAFLLYGGCSAEADGILK
jgi:hypothetical protein